jgi:hypothetical protein
MIGSGRKDRTRQWRSVCLFRYGDGTKQRRRLSFSVGRAVNSATAHAAHRRGGGGVGVRSSVQRRRGERQQSRG